MRLTPRASLAESPTAGRSCSALPQLYVLAWYSVPHYHLAGELLSIVDGVVGVDSIADIGENDRLARFSICCGSERLVVVD